MVNQKIDNEFNKFSKRAEELFVFNGLMMIWGLVAIILCIVGYNIYSSLFDYRKRDIEAEKMKAKIIDYIRRQELPNCTGGREVFSEDISSEFKKNSALAVNTFNSIIEEVKAIPTGELRLGFYSDSLIANNNTIYSAKCKAIRFYRLHSYLLLHVIAFLLTFGITFVFVRWNAKQNQLAQEYAYNALNEIRATPEKSFSSYDISIMRKLKPFMLKRVIKVIEREPCISTFQMGNQHAWRYRE